MTTSSISALVYQTPLHSQLITCNDSYSCGFQSGEFVNRSSITVPQFPPGFMPTDELHGAIPLLIQNSRVIDEKTMAAFSEEDYRLYLQGDTTGDYGVGFHKEYSAKRRQRFSGRTRNPNFTNKQLDALNELYLKCQYPSVSQKTELAMKLSVSYRRVSVWFQNNRSKLKRVSNPDFESQIKMHSAEE